MKHDTSGRLAAVVVQRLREHAVSPNLSITIPLPTSSLDLNNRAEIQQAIDDAAAGRLGAIPPRNLGAREDIQ